MPDIVLGTRADPIQNTAGFVPSRTDLHRVGNVKGQGWALSQHERSGKPEGEEFRRIRRVL
jgi:hypothetical protein